jgi:ferric-dicitrate binding protein FerR (iron transport regulator)
LWRKVKSFASVLTAPHKAFNDGASHMKNETKQRLKAAALAVLAIAALLLLGWLETQAGLPNH